MEEIESQLKQLILDEDFTNLQNLVSEEVNLMEILRVADKELPHSNFLAWLFNPSESHNLNDFAIKEFIKLYYRNNQFEDLGFKTKLSVFDFVHLDFDDLEIKREHKHIDLILLSEKNKFCIIIENKIKSSESEGQLKKYRNWIENEYPNFKYKIYIFLSLFQQEISEEEREHYLVLDYTHIVKLIDQIIQTRNLSEQSRFVFEQYLQTLKSMLNQNEEIELIAQNLYKKYKSAFDLVLKYAEKNQGGLIWSNNIAGLVRNEPKVEFLNSTSSRVYLIPSFFHTLLPTLKEKGLVPTDYTFKSDYAFLFEFVISATEIIFYVRIGKADESIRTKLYEFYSRHQDFFDKVNKGEKFKIWHEVFQRTIVSKNEYDKSLINEDFDIQQLIVENFRKVIENDLPTIEKIFKKELTLND